MENVTIKEIENQFTTWQKIPSIIEQNNEYIKECLQFIDDQTLVIFTGAGTSGYIGDSIAGYLNQYRADNIYLSNYSTNIVGNPKLYFANKKVLLVSFARSGNSPESVEVVKLANEYTNTCKHLIVTCNSDGSLYKQYPRESILLPSETNDLGFAMTNSFSTMLITSAVIFGIDIDIENLVYESKRIYYNFPYEKTLDFDFENIVYLANSENVGLLNELKLKMVELTNGRFGYYSDQFLNFRHGPKSVLTKKSLIFMLTSNDPITNQYENDLVNEICNDKSDVMQVTFGNILENADISVLINMSGLAKALCSVPCLQKMAVLKSIKEGINPDNPAPSGEVNRVVQGVIIHERTKC